MKRDVMNREMREQIESLEEIFKKKNMLHKLGIIKYNSYSPWPADKFPGLDEFAKICALIDLPLVSEQIDRIREKINKGQTTLDYKGDINDLWLRIIDGLKEEQFLHISRKRIKYYLDMNHFGQEVVEKFPLAIDDIEDAGKCLAVGQGTACILHLMRVMEHGLRSLGKALGVPYAPSWESYLKQIADRIAAKHKTKGIRWKRDESFFRDISGDLITIKQAWRNPTMHVGRKYSVEEAEEIYAAVRSFMNRLATRFYQV